MKRRLRKHVKQLLAAMSPEEAAARSRKACALLLELPEYARAQSVMLYAPIAGEIDCLEIALDAWQRDTTVLLPRVSLEQRHMIAVRCRSLDDEMTIGSFGIREPARGEPWPIEEIDFIVTPALAYDRQGNRLGRGGGFYDRFLAQPGRRGVACGLAFAQQVVDEVPADSRDQRVDMLVTDEDVLRFGPSPGKEMLS